MEVWEVVVRGQCSEFTVSEALQFQGHMCQERRRASAGKRHRVVDGLTTWTSMSPRKMAGPSLPACFPLSPQ